MDDNDMADLAGLLDKVQEPLGRLGTLYPGESPNSFDPEDEMTEDNESPTTPEEQAALDRRTLDELNPRKLSEEGRAWLASAMPAERRKRLQQVAINRM